MHHVQLLETGWKFCIDAGKEGISAHWEETGIPNASSVCIPHTWNVEEETQAYRGLAWYECQFEVPADWESNKLRIRFRGIYRDADVWLNGNKLGSHYHSGYTPFTLEADHALSYGKSNRLTVSVNNAPSEEALPYLRSFDWADDGGIYRPVELILTGKHAIDSVKGYTLELEDESGVCVQKKEIPVLKPGGMASILIESSSSAYGKCCIRRPNGNISLVFNITQVI